MLYCKLGSIGGNMIGFKIVTVDGIILWISY